MKITWKNKQQEEYYQRTTKFLNSNKHILINPGGMGLGKTIATIQAIKDNIHNFSFFFIANPTATLKNVWAGHFNWDEIGYKNKYMIWYAKDECCQRKINEPYFNVQNCKDDSCKFIPHLYSNKEHSIECYNHLKNISLPIDVYDFLKKHPKDCFLPINRLGMKERNIIIGDYFGMLNKGMFSKVTGKELNNACLVVDEAHLLPDRAKDYLSKRLRFKYTINKLKEEINCDYLLLDMIKRNRFERTIESLYTMFDSLQDKYSHTKEPTIRYSFNDFVCDYNKNKCDFAFEVYELRDIFTELSKLGYNDDSPWLDKQSPECKKFAFFIALWQEKANDKNYAQYFQYSTKTKEDIYFHVVCNSTGDYLYERFQRWNKVLLNSGTITDIEYFKTQLGLIDSNCEFANIIPSYSIREDVLIYPLGDFRSGKRTETYKKNNKLLTDILKNVKGRTLMFIQNKNDSQKLAHQLKLKGFEIIDFCQNDDGVEISKRDFNECMDKFNSSKKGVGIINLMGRVEGNNFLDEDNYPVSNIIIYGYPFPYTQGIICQDQIKYYTDLTKNEELAKKWVIFVPILNKIHQACCRSKREEHHHPTIILWDSVFHPNRKKFGAYGFMPVDLKGTIIENEMQLMSIIKNKKDDRNNL